MNQWQHSEKTLEMTAYARSVTMCARGGKIYKYLSQLQAWLGKQGPAVQKWRPAPNRKETHHWGREVGVCGHLTPHQCQGPLPGWLGHSLKSKNRRNTGLSVGRERYRWLYPHLTYSLCVKYENTMKDKLQKLRCIRGVVSLQIQQRSLMQTE